MSEQKKFAELSDAEIDQWVAFVQMAEMMAKLSGISVAEQIRVILRASRAIAQSGTAADLLKIATKPTVQ